MAGASSSADGNKPGSAGASEPGALLSAVYAKIDAQVPQSAQRDRVLDALRELDSGVNQKRVRVLAVQWGVRQKAGRENRTTGDIRQEVEENARRAATQLFEQEESVVLSEPTTAANSARSSTEKMP